MLGLLGLPRFAAIAPSSRVTRSTIRSSPIGSRKDQTSVYWDDSQVRVVCGCFAGTLEEFITEVDKTHPSGQHREDYIRLIETIICLTEGSK